jgi:hypothetical protein
MTLRVMTIAAALSLGASAAVAQGLSPCPPLASSPPSASIVPAPGGAAGEFLASILIAEAITFAPPASVEPPPAPAVSAAPPSYVAPGPTVVAPTPSGEPDSASTVDAYAAIDAGPTFAPRSSTFVLERPSHEATPR